MPRPARAPKPGLLVFVALAVTVVSNGHAQVNIEALRGDAGDTGLSGSVDVQLTVRTGNVELMALGMGGRLDYSTRTTSTFVVASGDLGWQGGERFSNEALVHARQMYLAHPRVAPEAFVQLNYNKARLLSIRGLIGAGVRIAVMETDRVQLSWGSGYMFEREELDLPPTAVHPTETSFHRWSNYFASKFEFSEQATLISTVYAQPRFADFGDIRALNDTQIGVAISSSVSLVSTFRLQYDSRPPDGIDTVDTNLRTGISLGF